MAMMLEVLCPFGKPEVDPPEGEDLYHLKGIIHMLHWITGRLRNIRAK